jgi:phosphoketolase
MSTIPRNIATRGVAPLKQQTPCLPWRAIEHKHYVAERGEDMPEISGWQWGQAGPRARPTGSTEADNV